MSTRKRKKFTDHPEFTPNLSPQDMFRLGSFGGTYWRPIYSRVTKKHYKNVHRKLPKSWWKGIPETSLSSIEYDKHKNLYGVKVGSSLATWENNHWIHSSHPYGWVQWYCDFYRGNRGADDERQIKRWLAIAGPKGRFRHNLINQIKKKNSTWNDVLISPKIRQVLQHWGYQLTKRDFDKVI